MDILLVEDDKNIREMVYDFLISENYSVKTAIDGNTAIEIFKNYSFDIILLDLMLPKSSGFEVLKYIRSVSVVPVIITTAKDSDTDKMLGLNLGADDYITKPFSIVELLARIKANIRRATVYSSSRNSQDMVIQYKDLIINISKYVVSKSGIALNLTHTEFEIVKLLATNQGRAFSKEQLYNAIWKEPYYGNENVLNTHINRLRNKLSDGMEKNNYIKTLWLQNGGRIMELFLVVISIVLFALYLKERNKSKKMESDYKYINSRLRDITNDDEINYILVPSDISIVKETAVDINKLLEKFYSRQINYNRSEKAILQIFTNISHDLRTPITVLKGYIEMLYLQSQKEELSSSMRATVEKMQTNSNELVNSINNLFNMAKIQSGDMILNLQKSNLTQLCHEIILEFYDLLDKENFNVEVNIEDRPIYANVDTEALQRILKNLIDNAIKYGSDGRFLGISLYEKEKHVFIDIEDKGSGISETEKEHIFTRAYTADRKKGNGLGLAISQGLANSMGGSIYVNSRPNVKKVFTLKLNS